jgi:hypothetical protein
VWGRVPREPALSEVEGSKPSAARRLRSPLFAGKLEFSRGLRAPPSQELHERISDLSASVVGDASSLAFDVFHEAVQVIARVGDTDDADGRLIPEQARVKFGDGNVERGAETIFEAARDLAFVFERVCGLDAKLESNESDQERSEVAGCWYGNVFVPYHCNARLRAKL